MRKKEKVLLGTDLLTGVKVYINRIVEGKKGQEKTEQLKKYEMYREGMFN